MTKNSKPKIVKTKSVDWVAEKNGDLEYRYKDLSGISLGARIEELPPGQSSSYHHYHTTEEEHLFMLSGDATLIFGNEEVTLSEGDHIWFVAGVEIAHHLENRSAIPCSYFVYGERKTGDVVVYPESQVMFIKALDRKQFTYRTLNEGTTE